MYVISVFHVKICTLYGKVYFRWTSVLYMEKCTIRQLVYLSIPGPGGMKNG